MSAGFLIKYQLVHHFIHFTLAETRKIKQYTVLHYALCRQVVVINGITERWTRNSGIKCSRHSCQHLFCVPVAECKCTGAYHAHQRIGKEIIQWSCLLYTSDA